MQLRVVQSAPKLILEWDPVPGATAGYRGRAGGVEKWTQTQQTRMTFAANATDIIIQALGIEDEGKYPSVPEPEPTPGSGALGLCLNASPSSAWLARAATLTPRFCREDTITQTKVDWAKANGVKFIGLCNLASVGVATSIAKVNAWPTITRWELDNEPYFQGVNVSAWAQQALSLAQQIKSAHPTHEVILPMLVQTNGGDYYSNGAWSPWAYQVLNAAPSIVNYVDSYSGHPYQPGKPPTTVFATMDKVRGQLVSRGEDKPWHMTEFGWSVGTGGTPPNTQVSAAEQAQYLTDIVTGMRTRPWIASMEVYCLQTWGTGYEHSFGLFNQDMSDRPAAVAYRSLV